MAPFALGGFRFPLGPDAPVYLWWIRLAGVDGLSAVGHRPGAPALALAAGGTLGLSEVQVVAALEGALGVATGLASAALLRAGGARRLVWVLGGVLAGTFAVHLAAGYLANLAFAVAFLAAAALLAAGTRRSAVGAAAVLGAGGLAHPLFFLVGGAVLLLSAAFAWRRDRAEALRIGGATLGAGAIVGVGLLALLHGPRPLEVDTSKDAFLRRAGLTGELRAAYLDRFVHRWARYVQWASVPLAIAGLRPAEGFLGRFLRAWGLVTIVGIAVSLATGIAPADRFVTFGFVVPLLASLGLARLWDRLRARRLVAVVATASLTAAMLAGAWIAWDRQEPFMSPLEVARVTSAAAYAAGTRPGTTLVFLVNEDDPALTFLVTRAANVIRAGVTPERIRDVVIRVPWPMPPAPTERWKLAHLTRDDARAVEAAGNGRSVTFILEPFDRVDLPANATAPGYVAPGVFASSPTLEPQPLADPLAPSSPQATALGAFAVFVALTSIGYGWARAAGCEGSMASALAPAFGAAALTIVAIALERLGVPLTGTAGPVAVSALGGASGYLAWFVLQRRAGSRPAPQVEQQPPGE